jgi:MoaA/NifB/PqqE/SkfB family radical SAM enzyme
MNKVLCAAPWKSLHINPTGQIRTCCAGADILGSIKDSTVQDVIFGDKLKEVRQTIMDGNLHKEYCKYCIASEKESGTSERQWHNDVAGDFELPEDHQNYHEINLLDVRWNITCNMSCNYCGPFASSRWMKMIDGTEVNPPAKHIDAVLAVIEQQREHVKQVCLIGGEPLLLKDNIRLLDILDKNTEIGLISNLNVDLNTNKVYQNLQKFDHVNWSISFENTHEDFEYVRYGGCWDRMVHNLTQLRENKNFNVILAPVYNIYSVTKLTAFYEWLLSQGLTVNWSYLMEPHSLSVANQTKIHTAALDEIEQILKLPPVTRNEREFFVRLLATFRNAEPVDMSDIFINTFTDDIENKYHPDKKGQFKRLWPQLYSLLTS